MSTAIIKVSELNQYIKKYLEENLSLNNISVEGEISDYKLHRASGHIYFSIKDAQSSIACVMFRSSAASLTFEPQSGDAVVVKGSIGVYAKSGTYQLYVTSMKPQGIGDLQAQYEKLKAKLLEEGIFKSEQQKRKLPKFPHKIGIVTSATGAAIRDMLKVITRRWPLADILLVPATVQGKDGAKSICDALEMLYQRYDIDAIIVGRGGGSIEDLWNFNEEIVVRKISSSPVPIISAVGHEVDVTLSDFAADVRAGTPSIAGELIVPDMVAAQDYLLQRKEQMDYQMMQLVSHNRQVLQGYLANSIFSRPDQVLSSYHIQLDKATTSIENAFGNFYANINSKFSEYAARLDALSPLKILERGYSYSENHGQPVKSINDVQIDDVIEITLTDGAIQAQVQSIAGRK